MKKICFFSGDVTRNGGTERVSIMIANELSKQSDLEIVFISLVEQNEKPFYEMDARIKRHALGKKWLSPGPGYLPLIPRLRTYLKKEKIDLIIDIDIVLDVLSVPASRGLGTKVLSWEHSNCAFELAHGYRRVILKLFTRQTDWIVTLTPGDAKCFQKIMKRKERITAIPNPISRQILKLDGDRERALITVGRLVPEKGYDLLLKVAELVLPCFPDWKWYLCGEGQERERIERVRAEKGLEKQLILCGLVPRVEEYLAKSRLFVLTSRTEGLPMCLLEARSMGVPCVSFDIPTGPADIIANGVNGYLIPAFAYEDMANKVKELLADPEKLEKMGKAAGENLEPFFMERVIGEWNDVINRLLE